MKKDRFIQFKLPVLVAAIPIKLVPACRWQKFAAKTKTGFPLPRE